MEKVFGDHLTCPICMDIPTGRIYQCRNGHPICKPCSRGLPNCPQCRVEFETPKIRLRLLETLVENMEVGCSYNAKGCQFKVLKKDLQAHLEICEFRPTMEFCKLVHFTDCSFESSHPAEIFEHLCENHEVEKLFAQNYTTTIAKNFGNFASNQGNTGVYIKLWEAEQEHDISLYFVICMIISAERGDCSFVCIHMGDVREESVRRHLEDLKITFDVIDPNVTNASKLTWSTKPTDFQNTKSILQNPPVRIPLEFLKEHIGNGRNDYTLILKITLTEN